MKHDPSGYWNQVLKSPPEGHEFYGNQYSGGGGGGGSSGEVFSFSDATKHEQFGKFSGKEMNNSNGQLGFGNKVTEFSAKGTKDKVRVIDSKYSERMGRGGEALNGYIRVSHYPKGGVSFKDEHTRKFSGDNRQDRAGKFLNKQYGIKWPL